MNKLEKRAEQVARARRQIAMERIAARLEEQLHGVRIELEQSEIRIVGRDLVKRWLSDTGLRFVAGMVK